MLGASAIRCVASFSVSIGLLAATAFEAHAKKIHSIYEPAAPAVSLTTQNWSTPNPAPELWNEDQVTNCAETAFVGELESHRFTTPDYQMDPKDHRITLIPHREEEVEYQFKVREPLRGPLAVGDKVFVKAFPAIEQAKEQEIGGSLSDKEYRVALNKGESYVIFDVPSHYSARKFDGARGDAIKIVRRITSDPKTIERCRQFNAWDQTPPTSEKITFAGMDCEKAEKIQEEEGLPHHAQCKLTCRQDGKEVFAKEDYCAELLVASPDGKFLAGLSGYYFREYAFWVIDATGRTWTETMQTKLAPKVDSDYGYGGAGALLKQYSAERGGGAKQKTKVTAQRRFLERFGPATVSSPFWYDRFNPHVEFEIKDGALQDVRVAGYDHKVVSFVALGTLKPYTEKELVRLRWKDPTERVKARTEDLNKVIGKHDLSGVRAALAAGSDPNYGLSSSGRYGYSYSYDQNMAPLLFATSSGRVEIVKALIDAGADVDVRERDNATALHVAERNKNEEIVEILLKAHADPNVTTSSWGFTPLMHASMSGYVGIVRLLLAAGAKPDLKDKQGKTALDLAKEAGRKDIVSVLEKVRR